ncbi:hypothetical protein Dimus_038831 [Dionaea muscipula]
MSKQPWELAIEKLATAANDRFERLESRVDQLFESSKNIEVQLEKLLNFINVQNQKESEEVGRKEEHVEEVDVPIKQFVPPISLPQEFNKRMDHQLENFLEIFRQLHINIPFVDILAQVPAYVGFLKELVSKRSKLERSEDVILTRDCSAVIQKKFPTKLPDPGSFSIPYSIGDINFAKALCDAGSGVSLMPMSICRKLGLEELTLMSISLQLVDRSVKYPLGMLENALIKVENFIIPIDFVVIEMEEDLEVPIILRRPFFATVGVIFDVKNGKLTFEVENEKVKFNLFNSLKYPSVTNHVMSVDVTNESMSEIFREIREGLVEEDVPQVHSMFTPRRPYYEELGKVKPLPPPSYEQAPTLELKPLPSHLRDARRPI